MKRILVPTDFSASAQNTLNAAINMAKVSAAELIVIHVLEPAAPIYTDFSGPGYDMVSVFGDQAEQQLSELKKKSLAEFNYNIETKLYHGLGPVYETILEVGEEQKADLIMMGLKGAGKVLTKLLGSQTAAVIGNSPIPVLAVPIEYYWTQPVRILLATNHFEKDGASFKLLADFIKVFGAILNVVVFTNNKKDKAVTAISHNWDLNRYKEFLGSFFDQYVASEHLYGEDFEDSIMKYISTNNIDILAMFSYRRSFLERLINPSKTKQMSYHTTIPLLVIPARISNG